MNKNTFLSELSRKLRRLPKEDYDDAMRYYTEYLIDCGVDEMEDVTPLVGTVDEVTARIFEECTDKQMDKAVKEGGPKNNSKAIWYILLGIFAAPIAFPIAIVIAAVFFALVVAVFAVIIALLASSIGVVIAGIAALPAVFWAESGSMVCVILGLGCVAISIGVFFCIAFYKLGELLIKGLIKMFGKLGKSKKNKANANEQTYFSSGTDLNNDNMVADSGQGQEGE